MSDIVERLRLHAELRNSDSGFRPDDHICWAAADEIERLRAENARFKKECDEISGAWGIMSDGSLMEIRAVLAENAKLRDLLAIYDHAHRTGRAITPYEAAQARAVIAEAPR